MLGEDRAGELLYGPAVLAVAPGDSWLREKKSEPDRDRARRRVFFLETERRYQRRRKLWTQVADRRSAAGRGGAGRGGQEVVVSTRIVRLLSLAECTPLELLTRTVHERRFKTAMTLAAKYDLDTDTVLQAQWRLASVSRQAVDDILAKVVNGSELSEWLWVA